MKFKELMLFALPAALFSCGTSGNGNDDEDNAGTAIPGNIEVIYEANPKVFAEQDALKAISDRLDEIQSLGTTVLWLMPIYEQGELKASGSPYCVKDYYSVNPEYGTAEDLKALVTKAHDLGMKVILDWVANHTSWDNAWITEHDDWYTKNSAGDIVSPNDTWTDVADLNYGNAELRSAMIAAMKHWVTEAGVDGFRCDFAEGVPYDFWSSAIAELRNVKSGLLMLAEGGTAASDLFAAGFDMVYGWSFGERLGDVFAGTASASELYETLAEEERTTPDGKFRMRYSTNHDRASDASTCPEALYKTEDGAMAAFVTAAFMGGVPMIYGSQEIGHLQRINFFVYDVMDWDSNPQVMQEYVDVMNVYVESAELRGGEMKHYDTGDVLSFHYPAADGRGLFVMVNTTGESLTVRTPMERAGGSVRNLMTGESSSLAATVSLDAYQYLIYETH